MDSNVTQRDIENLKRLHLLSFVSLESIEGLLHRCSIRELQTEEILITPGRPNSLIYLLLSGRLRVHLSSLDSPAVDIVVAGESVGEMSVIDQNETSAFVVADESCRLLVMDEDVLWSITRSSHEAACNLLLTLTRRLRHANAVICKGVELEKAYRRYGTVDALTGLHNRYWLENSMKRQMTRCAMSKLPFSLILIDIDHFKEFNDSYGHLCGDKALYTVACTFMDNLRITETAARYGGDEFVVLLPELDLGISTLVAERLRQAVMSVKMVLPDGTELPRLTISLGIAQAEPGQTPEMLIAAADAALYQAKNKGRNCCSE